MHTDTLAVRAGRDDLRALGVHAPPVDFSTTYPFDDLEEAVHRAANMAAPGMIVLFSPAAPTPSGRGTWQTRSTQFRAGVDGLA